MKKRQIQNTAELEVAGGDQPAAAKDMSEEEESAGPKAKARTRGRARTRRDAGDPKLGGNHQLSSRPRTPTSLHHRDPSQTVSVALPSEPVVVGTVVNDDPCALRVRPGQIDHEPAEELPNIVEAGQVGTIE